MGVLSNIVKYGLPVMMLIAVGCIGFAIYSIKSNKNK